MILPSLLVFVKGRWMGCLLRLAMDNGSYRDGRLGRWKRSVRRSLQTTIRPVSFPSLEQKGTHPSPQIAPGETFADRAERSRSKRQGISLRRLRFALLTEKAHQLGRDFFGMRPGNAVRAAFDHRQLGPFDQFGGPLSRRLERHDTVAVAVNDERRHIHAI